MATIRKRGNTWRAEVYRDGRRLSATRATKAEALAWATATQAELDARKLSTIPPHTALEAFERYARDVSPTKRGARWEKIRLAKLGRTVSFRGMLLEDIRTPDIAAWRDSAIAGGLAPSSVRREMVLLRSVFNRARREWHWMTGDPMAGVTYPAHGQHRTRRVSDAELAALALACGYGDDDQATTTTQRVGAAILFAIETGMRAGEIVGLRWLDIDRTERAARLPKTKNGASRAVPLSRAALALLDTLPPGEPQAPAFAVTSASLDALFRRARARAGLEDLHFHDLRHEATTRLARRLAVLDLAAMIGHKDLRSLQIYYNPTTAELAARLD
jgi:integrase